MIIENTPTLVTERLILRRFEKSDEAALFELLRDDEVNTFLPMFVLKTQEEAKSHLWEKYLKSYEKPFGYRYAVCLKGDNIPIGYVNVSDSESHDFGYCLAKSFWHGGIITEAATAIVKRLKESGLPFITATHDVNNPRSGGVMKQIGMTYRYSYEECVQPKDMLVTFRMYQLNFDGNEEAYSEYWDKYSVHFIEENI